MIAIIILYFNISYKLLLYVCKNSDRVCITISTKRTRIKFLWSRTNSVYHSISTLDIYIISCDKHRLEALWLNIYNFIIQHWSYFATLDDRRNCTKRIFLLQRRDIRSKFIHNWNNYLAHWMSSSYDRVCKKKNPTSKSILKHSLMKLFK